MYVICIVNIRCVAINIKKRKNERKKRFCRQRNNELNVLISKIWCIPDYARSVLASKGY